MYSLVLMTAMTAAAPETPNFFGVFRCHWGRPVAACWGCHGCYGCAGWRAGCWGCYGGCYGCSGCVGVRYHSCAGCTGCVGMPYATASWGANYTYTHSYPGMKPTYIPTVVPAANTQKTEGTAAETSARLIFNVPQDAKVYVDGQLMKSSANTRYFYTPPLEKGQSYFYDVKVELSEKDKNGKPIVKEKPVIVRAGEVVRESFSTVDTTSVATATNK